jgi:exopolysaccharide production protein ExoY
VGIHDQDRKCLNFSLQRSGDPISKPLNQPAENGISRSLNGSAPVSTNSARHGAVVQNYPAIHSIRFIESAARLRFLYRVERIAAFILLVILSPLALVIAVAIFALSRRGPLISHNRVGWRGAPIAMLKFRTMWDAMDARSPFLTIENVGGGSSHLKQPSDARVTSRFASLCRRFSLDEIPQLYHVVRGDMSLVGPRPLTLWELQKYYGQAMPAVLSLRPGLTGLWQLKGRSRLTYAQRRRLDLLLVRNMSVGLYLRILLKSVPKVLAGADAY